MKSVIKCVVLVSILTILFSCETSSLENDLGITEELNDEYSTEPEEDLEPGGSGGGNGSDKEEL